MTRAPRPFPRDATRAVTAALAALVAAASWSPALAIETPRLVPFQGRLADGSGTPLSGVHDLAFAIYDEATGGTALWSEVHTNVPVIAGQVNVFLGSLTSLDDPDANGNGDDAIRFDGTAKPKFLGIKIGGGSAQELVPRHQLVPSFHARLADTTVENGVGTPQLKDRAVTTAKLDPAALIPPGSILPYGGQNAPPGWVLCDGTTYDGNDPEYVALFQAIGTSFGGSGTQFKVPDLRGEFLRGRDAGRGVDPDVASRAGGDASLGAALRVGSTQGSAVFPLQGQYQGTTIGGGNHGHSVYQLFYYEVGVGGAFGGLVQNWGSPGRQIDVVGPGAHSHTVPPGPVTVTPTNGATSTEVRPRNVAVNYICKL